MTTTRSSSNSKVLEEFQKEIIDEDDSSTRLKFIKELEKYRERKDLGIRNYPESCMERMLSDDQVHGI